MPSERPRPSLAACRGRQDLALGGPHAEAVGEHRQRVAARAQFAAVLQRAAGAHEADPDGQGRVTIPAHLREYATLAGEAVVIGNSDHLEVWEPGRWRAQLARVQTDIERDLRDLGI